MANDYIDQWDLNTVVYDIHDKGRGQPNGVATLDENGRVPYEQLPESSLNLKGYWDASTNTPTLADGTGTSGDFYFVSVAGTQNLGSGSQYFAVGDRVLYDGSVWRNIAGGTVRTINGQSPDSQGNISGIVTSVNGATPNSSGAVSVFATFSEPDKAKILGSRTGLRYKGVYENSTLGNAILCDIAYGLGLYVAVFRTGETGSWVLRIRYSTDCQHWTNAGILPSTNYYKFYINVFYLENYGFVVCSARDNFAYTSPDGINWTDNSSNISNMPTGILRMEDGVTFVAWGSDNVKVTKDKGQTFSSISLPASTSMSTFKEYIDEKRRLLNTSHSYPSRLVHASSNDCWYFGKSSSFIGSTDAITWQDITSPFSSIYSLGYSQDYLTIQGRVNTDNLTKRMNVVTFTTTPSMDDAYLPSVNDYIYGYDQNVCVGGSVVAFGGARNFLWYGYYVGGDSSASLWITLTYVCKHNGLFFGFSGGSSYPKSRIVTSVDGVHWSSLPMKWANLLTNPSDSNKQLELVGFVGGRWILRYYSVPGADFANPSVPSYMISTLDEDFEEMI